jgi:hypothetical protein
MPDQSIRTVADKLRILPSPSRLHDYLTRVITLRMRSDLSEV